MKRGTVETAVGIFVIIGIACVAYLAVQLGDLKWFDKSSYLLEAYFTSASGLKSGAVVELAGVQVGTVEKIDLDPETLMAQVMLKINKGIELTDDVIASIKTAGLIGDKFIKLTPGSSGQPLPPGGTIMDTESALDIEDLISKFVFGKV
jgi:phospholipid/cholesterol/gamma-HCH transport system substrate-binding protein